MGVVCSTRGLGCKGGDRGLEAGEGLFVVAKTECNKGVSYGIVWRRGA